MLQQWNPLRLTAERTGSRAVALVILGIYAAATLYVALHHEPWRDEADSWLVARDATVSEIFGWTRYAGTPAVWYLTLKPLIWLGLPYPSQQFLHLAIAWSAAALLLFRGPFTWVTKILLLTGYYFAYEYAVIVRSYALTIAIAFVIAAWYRERHQRPIRYAFAIALLCNVNVHGAVIAGAFGLEFILSARRGRLSRAAVIVMAAGALVLLAQLRTPADAAIPGLIRHVRMEVPLLALDTALLPGVWLRSGGIAPIAVIVLLAVALRRRRDALLILLLPLVSLIVLYTLIWFGGYRHSGLILLTLLLAVWVAGEVRHGAVSAAAAGLLNASLLVSAAFTFQIASADVEMAFSGGREMGEFIRSAGFDRYEIAAHNFQQAEAVLPWVPGKRFWYPALGRYGTYMKWNREEEIGLRMPHALAVQRAVAQLAPRGEPWLLLLNAPLPSSVQGFELLYTNQRPVFRHRDERYWLYGYRPIR